MEVCKVAKVLIVCGSDLFFRKKGRWRGNVEEECLWGRNKLCRKAKANSYVVGLPDLSGKWEDRQCQRQQCSLGPVDLEAFMGVEPNPTPRVESEKSQFPTFHHFFDRGVAVNFVPSVTAAKVNLGSSPHSNFFFCPVSCAAIKSLGHLNVRCSL